MYFQILRTCILSMISMIGARIKAISPSIVISIRNVCLYSLVFSKYLGFIAKVLLQQRSSEQNLLCNGLILKKICCQPEEWQPGLHKEHFIRKSSLKFGGQKAILCYPYKHVDALRRATRDCKVEESASVITENIPQDVPEILKHIYIYEMEDV